MASLIAAGLMLVATAVPATAADSAWPTGVLLAQAGPMGQGQPTPQQRAEMIRQSLAMSQARLRSYAWIETTVVTKGGEEKSRVQKRCYYGVDGVLQKLVVDQSAAQSGGPPGILPFGRLIKKAEAKKKEELQDYMKNAVALVHSYVPPLPGSLKTAVQAGNFSLQVLQPGQLVALNFANYLKPGDSLGIRVDVPTDRLTGLAVASYLDTPQNAVNLNVTMGVLPDGTIYPAQSVLVAPAKDLTVTVENTGYQLVGQGSSSGATW